MSGQNFNQMLELIDTHCHLDFDDFKHDRDDILNQCFNIGVKHIVVPSVTKQTFQRTLECCANSSEQNTSQLHLALGLHPVFIEQHQPQHLLDLDSSISQNREQVIAVGEIGLDFYQKELDQEKQSVFFAKQLIIAKRHHLPVIIHNRKAHDLCISLLIEHDVDGGIIHAFNGSIQQAHKYHELGFKLGFGGMLTYPRSSKLRRLAKELPLDAIVLETDAPDMSVIQYKGEQNSPAYLPYVLESLAEVREESIETLAQTTSANAKTVLRLDT